jgi:hypothetical protein
MVAGRDHLCREHRERYADTELGLADASLVAVAERFATLDERHFRLTRPLTADKAFRLLPTDA